VATIADVSVASDVERFVKYVVDRWTTIDVLVNNAGVAPPRLSVCQTDPDDWARTLAINLTGPFLMARAVVPYMKPGSAIINVSSRLGRGLVDQGRGAYAASKYGLEGLTRFLAEELCDRGIAVNAVAPGLIATELSQWQGASPESIADVFVHLASNRAIGITGKALYAPTWRSELGLI
jgi:NAD(P)-dependent dehydrogenase (short-subunit alcohol dehydrogenase family)